MPAAPRAGQGGSGQRLHRLWSELTNWVLPSVVAPYILTRVALLVAAEVAVLSIPHYTVNGPAQPPESAAWISPLLQQDAGLYLRIATSWYQYSSAADPSANLVAFFPLYPILVRGLNLAVSGSADTLAMSALIVANSSALLGITMLFRLVQREFGAALAQRTVWYFLIFPVSFYLSSAYAEPVFLAASVSAIYAARSGRWWLAGVAGAAASLSRGYGVLIVLPLIVEYFRSQRENWRTRVQVNAAWLLLPLIALAGWMGYLYSLTGDPLIFIRSQVAWEQQHITLPLETLLTNYARARDQQLQGKFDLQSLQFVVAALGTAVSIAAWRVLPSSYALFATASCLVVLGSGSLLSIWRHVYLIFPLFIVAAKAGALSKVFDRAYVAFGLIFSGLLFTILATGWHGIS